MNSAAQLGADQLHVWRASLDLPNRLVLTYRRQLPEEERMRATTFRSARDSGRFIVARGILRDLLGYYTGLAGGRILIQSLPTGKPFLPNQPHLHFNLTRSHDMAVFAIAHRPVGVDIEQLRPLEDFLAIAEHFFSPAELADLHEFPIGQQLKIFLSCWTRKEAYLKARGLGLSLPLNTFAVSLAPESPKLLFADDEPEGPQRWKLSNLVLGDGFVGTVVIERGFRELVQFVWSYGGM